MAKADLHIHTRVSDGFATIDQLLAHVEHATDLDVIAVTDHEDAAGGHRAKEAAARLGCRFEVVVGAEVTTLQGHLLALWIDECPKSFRSLERTLEEIHRQGGVAIAPHPTSWLTRSLSQRTIDRVQSRGEAGVTLDAMETANPSPAGRIVARRAAGLADRWSLPATGSSDAHYLLHVGSGWTEFDGGGEAGLRAALGAGTTRPGLGAYPSLREIGVRNAALGLAWGYAATPRKMLRMARPSGRMG